MAKLPYAQIEALPSDIQQFLGGLPPLNVFRMVAHSPELLRAVATLSGAIRAKCTLDDQVRELAITRVGHLMGSSYETIHHEHVARAIGTPESKIAELRHWQLSSEFSEIERLALAATDLMVLQGTVDDELRDRLVRTLGIEGLMDLMVTVGFYRMVCTILVTTRVDLEQDVVKALFPEGTA